VSFARPDIRGETIPDSRSCRVKTPTIWNSLPSNVHSYETVTTFHRHLKSHLDARLNRPNVKAAELNSKIAVNLVPVFLLVLLLHLHPVYHTAHNS